MKIIPVRTKQDITKFYDVARWVYRDNPYWVCPLDSVIEDIFDPKKNVFFQHGSAERWILQDDKGRYIGRVAAFINEKKAYNFDQPTGGLGFFEVVNNKQAAFKLFDTAKAWLQERGMEAVDGPINFGENDNFWGLLVEGFESTPAFGMNYHQPYYKDFFEAYGFEVYFEQVTNMLDLSKPFPERFWRIADRVRQRSGYLFKPFRFEQQDKFIADLKEVYDDAWRFHENFTPINAKDVKHSLDEARPFFDEDLVWFVYHQDEPIAFFIMYPDFNEILKHFNGKIKGLGVLKYLWLKSRKSTFTRTRVTIMGVKPRYQRMGIESGIFWHLRKVMDKKPHYKELELSWVGNFNPKMMSLHKATESTFGHKHITYRKVFDPNKHAGTAKVIPREKMV